MKNLDFSELNDFSQYLLKLAVTEMPKETKKFLKKEANKLKDKTKRKANSRVKKQSGNYLKGWKSGEVYKYKNDEMAIRVYNSNYHAHLVENGHRQVTKDGREIGFVKGQHILRDSTEAFENQYFNDVEEFIDDLLGKGL